MTFDLKKCHKNADGHYVARTRDGRDVRILVWDAKVGTRGICPLVGLVMQPEGFEDTCCWEENGRAARVGERPDDLVNIIEKRHRSIVLYRLRTGEAGEVSWQYTVRMTNEPPPPCWERVVTQRIEWEE